MKHTIQQRINIAVTEKYGAISKEASHLGEMNRMVTSLIHVLEDTIAWAKRIDASHDVVQSLEKIVRKAKKLKTDGDTPTLP